MALARAGSARGPPTSTTRCASARDRGGLARGPQRRRRAAPCPTRHPRAPTCRERRQGTGARRHGRSPTAGQRAGQAPGGRRAQRQDAAGGGRDGAGTGRIAQRQLGAKCASDGGYARARTQPNDYDRHPLLGPGARARFGRGRSGLHQPPRRRRKRARHEHRGRSRADRSRPLHRRLAGDLELPRDGGDRRQRPQSHAHRAAGDRHTRIRARPTRQRFAHAVAGIHARWPGPAPRPPRRSPASTAEYPTARSWKAANASAIRAGSAASNSMLACPPSAGPRPARHRSPRPSEAVADTAAGERQWGIRNGMPTRTRTPPSFNRLTDRPRSSAAGNALRAALPGSRPTASARAAARAACADIHTACPASAACQQSAPTSSTSGRTATSSTLAWPSFAPNCRSQRHAASVSRGGRRLNARALQERAESEPIACRQAPLAVLAVLGPHPVHAVRAQRRASPATRRRPRRRSRTAGWWRRR